MLTWNLDKQIEKILSKCYNAETVTKAMHSKQLLFTIPVHCLAVLNRAGDEKENFDHI